MLVGYTNQCTTQSIDESAPDAVPETYPRPDVAVYPVIPRSAKKDVSIFVLGVPLRLKYIRYGPCRPCRYDSVWTWPEFMYQYKPV